MNIGLRNDWLWMREVVGMLCRAGITMQRSGGMVSMSAKVCTDSEIRKHKNSTVCPFVKLYPSPRKVREAYAARSEHSNICPYIRWTGK